MKDNGSETCGMASEGRSGLMGQFIKVSGGTTKLKEKESSLTQMEITMRESGRMIRLMDMVYSFM
jgi:hypothetical protein